VHLQGLKPQQGQDQCCKIEVVYISTTKAFTTSTVNLNEQAHFSAFIARLVHSTLTLPVNPSFSHDVWVEEKCSPAWEGHQ